MLDTLSQATVRGFYRYEYELLTNRFVVAHRIFRILVARISPKKIFTFTNAFFYLQDGTFSVLDFCDEFLSNDVQRVLRAYPDTISMDIHCAQLGHWSSLPDKNFTKLCKIRINPVDILDSGNEKLNAFTGKSNPLIAQARKKFLEKIKF